MTAIPHAPSPYLPVFSAAGDAVPAGSAGALLASGTTYYVPAGSDAAELASVHLRWDASAILTITVEDSNDPGAALTSSTAGEWCQENPSDAYVGGSGFSLSALTISVAGGTAGGAMVHIGNAASLRTRIKIVVGGTGGRVHAMGHAKS